MIEQVILVDKHNRKLSFEEKINAHKEGRLHRAFSIFIFNSKTELLIQQRAKTKYHSARLWSNTADGHPRPGEYCIKAAKRRLKEEMGIECELKKAFNYKFQAKVSKWLIENEFDEIFIGQFDGIPIPNPTEVEAYKWVSLEELRKELARKPKKYTVWFKKLIKFDLKP